jgi:hypothetical protein
MTRTEKVILMRMILAGLCLIATIGLAAAQDNQKDTSAMGAAHGLDSPPATQGLSGSQGSNSPAAGKSDAAPNLQSQTTPGMQAGPGGSSPTRVDPKVDAKR